MNRTRNRVPLPKVAHPLRTVAPEVETDSIVAVRPRGGAGWPYVLIWVVGAALALVATVLFLTR